MSDAVLCAVVFGTCIVSPLVVCSTVGPACKMPDTSIMCSISWS
jgi:hypothetical protein